MRTIDWLKLAVFWSVGGTFVACLIGAIIRYCNRPAPGETDDVVSLHDRIWEAHHEHDGAA